MLFMVHVKLAKPAGMSNREFYGVWAKEAEAAVAKLQSGALTALYKVGGKPEVIALMDVDSADAMDHAINNLPLWKLGYSHVVTELTWTALRPYAHWAEDLKELARD
jgi:muconolactone delta-isomerase